MTDTATRSRLLLDGRYELQSLVGQGTFGRVYRAYDRRLARSVAVKLIKPWWTEDPEWAERFEREAQLMARVSSPGILQIHDIGHSEEGAYYVAELVDGESLADRLRRGALSPLEALDLAEQLCRALAAAHDQRVVHRDVKPGNVLIAKDGHVKVGDFGVARLAEAGTDVIGGTVLGTPRYMAPEQARGGTPTPASDVYGAGVVLYEMLAGRPPFLEHGAVELALRHISDPPPPLPSATPPALAQVVERALAKDPHDRYPTGREMADALGRARSRVARAAGGSGTAPTAARNAPSSGPAETRVAPRRTPRRNVNPSEARRYRALLALVVLILGGMVAGVVLTSGGTASVPSLRGLDRAAAKARLRPLDLTASFRKRYDGAVAGTVIAQAPAAGRRVADGTVVHVVMSAGPRPIPVPQVLGQRSVAAQAILSRLGLGATITQVAAPGVTPGLVVQQSPTVNHGVPPRSRVRLSVAEVPRWRPLTSFSGHGAGASVPFQIRGARWRIVYSMGYDGVCSFIFFCSGPSVTVTNAVTGATVNKFDLNDGDRQIQSFSAGPGTYRIAVAPGSDSAHWSIQAQDDY